MLWFILVFVLPGVALAAPEDDGVLVLDEKNFEETVKSNPFVLVMFYAPWCGHCKHFAPDYAAAGAQMKLAKPAVPFAKIDATSEVKVAEDYGVRGYPTIKLFVDGKDQEYTGGRTAENIAAWVLKKVGPPALHLEDAAAAEAFGRDNKLAVVGLFEAGASREAFETAARRLEDVMFGYVTNPKLFARYDLNAPAVRMYFPHDEKTADYNADGGMDVNNAGDIEAFVRAHRQPIVSIFNGETSADIFGDGRPILFLFRDKDEKGEAAEQELRQVAHNLKRRLLVAVSGSREPMDQRLMDYVTVDAEELPTVRIVANPMASMKKFKLDGEITAASMGQFVQDFEANRLRPHMKSEAAPTSQTGSVVTLVGTTFNSIVKDNSKDVLVEFYAPWCGHCKKLEPVYRDVAKKLEGVPSLVIAKMDATSNDVEGLDVEGFPTIKLWRARKKDEPLDYDSDRDVESFITWLEQKVSTPFSRDDLRNEL